MGLCLEAGDESAEGCLVKIRGQTNVDDVMVGVCYRLPDQDIDEAFLRQLEGTSFAGPGPHGNMNDICWKSKHCRVKAICEISH